MNYDEVGYAAADGGSGVTGSHHTLPLPSYVEVTSLASGKTILVRVVRRGPMDGEALIALSPAAFAQLGAAAGDPVRVRRVNPPEQERAALRAGRTAPPRMDTPASLVAVLKRKLAGGNTVTLTPRPAAPVAVAAVAPPASAAHPKPPVQPVAATQAPPPPAAPVAKAPPAARGVYVVQAGAMSTLERGQNVARGIDGNVSRAGRYFRVRTGPFATRAQAEASLAKVRAAGYSDARISTNG
jgi:rare lipoprotein A